MQGILKNKKFRLFSSAALLVSALVITAAITFAKYVSEEKEQGTIELKAFTAEPQLYIGDTLEVPATVPMTGENEGHLVSYYDIPVDQVNDLKVSVKYSGQAKTYTRLKMDMVWYQTKHDNNTGNDYNEIIFHKYPEYTLADNVFDNTSADSWFYFNEVLNAEDEEIFPAITAISSDLTNDNVGDPVFSSDRPDHVRIYLTVDCVQYNRALQVWGLEKWPWDNSYT